MWSTTTRGRSAVSTLFSRSFSSNRPLWASPSLSADQDHYQNLGVQPNATRKQIKDKFYDLSKRYHPDAPSTSSLTPDERTSRFQQLSQSYSVLSDPASRKSYDLSRSGIGGGVPPHRRGRHPGYTQGSGGMGYASGGGGGGYTSRNEDRRQSANYAWRHPSNRSTGGGGHTSAGSTASSDASSRPNPFAERADGRTGFGGDHLARFAKRARMRQAQTMGREAQMAKDGHYRAGTAVFGRAKAEEESRLINDSSTLRSSQVLFVFGSVFVLAWIFSGGHDRHEPSTSRKTAR